VFIRETKKRYVLEDDYGTILMICSDKRIIKHFAKEFQNERNDPGQKSLPNKQASHGVGINRPNGGGNSSDNHKPREDGGS
jgi:hypothetical protein